MRKSKYARKVLELTPEQVKRHVRELSDRDQRIHDLEAALRTIYSQCKDGGHLTADWIGWEGIRKILPGVIDG